MKVARHTKILELIDNYDIETQEELAKKLQEAGFTVTQATVSRDVREMRLTKIATSDGKQKYAVTSNTNSEIAERSVRVFKEAVTKMDYAQNTIVIKTLAGMANAVGAALDNMQENDIIGTLAGDDTVFCLVKSQQQAAIIIEKLYKMIHVS